VRQERCIHCGVVLPPEDQFCGECGTPRAAKERAAAEKGKAAPKAEKAATGTKPGLVFWLIASVAILTLGLLVASSADEPNILSVYAVFVLAPALVVLGAVRPAHWLKTAGIAGSHQLLIFIAILIGDWRVDDEFVVAHIIIVVGTAALAAGAAAISKMLRKPKA
jgi:hypothetical protein